jgi:hypothetical protein
MRVEPNAGGRSHTVWLDDDDYAALRRATQTHREDLVCRLAAEVGLRSVEIPRVTPAHVSRYGSSDHYFLTVPDGDGGTRRAYLPADVEHDVRKYVGGESLDVDPLVDVSPRRVQMLVSEVADRAADQTGDDAFEHVSVRDLRRYFARTLCEQSVDPRVVAAVGGWESLGSLDPYLDDPTPAEIVHAFEPDTGTVEGSGNRFRTLVEAAGTPIYHVGADGRIQYVNPAFEALTGYDAAAVRGESPRVLWPDDADDTTYAEMREALVDGNRWEGTVVYRRDSGGRSHVHQTVAPIDESADGFAGFVAVATDVTQRTRESRELERERDRLERLQEVISTIPPIGEALMTVSTRDGIERAVCDHLADSDAYSFAWIGGVDARTDEIRPRAAAGIDVDRLERVTVTADDSETGRGPAGRAVRTGEVQVSQNALADPTYEEWREAAAELGYRAVAATPLAFGDNQYGVLCVYSDRPNAFDRREWTLLGDLGRRIGHAITAVERKKLLLADTRLQLEFECTDDRSFFVAASADLDCTFRVDGIVPVENRSLLYYLTMAGAPAETVLERAGAADAVADARLVRDYGDETLLEVVVTGDSPATTVMEYGGTVRDAIVEDGVERLVGEFSLDADVRSVVDGMTAAFPRTELVSKREVERPVETTAGFRQELDDRLTDKQRSALRAAYLAGYFEWPRGSTAEEVADSLGVSSPTLHNHLRKAEGKLLTTYFETAEHQPR